MSAQPITEDTRRQVEQWSTGGHLISEVAAADIAQRFGMLDAVQHGRVNEVKVRVASYHGHPAVSVDDNTALRALLDFSTQGGRY